MDLRGGNRMAIFCCLNQSAIHTGIPPVLLE